MHKLHVDADACAGPDGEHERESVVLRTVVGIGGGRWPLAGSRSPRGALLVFALVDVEILDTRRVGLVCIRYRSVTVLNNPTSQRAFGLRIVCIPVVVGDEARASFGSAADGRDRCEPLAEERASRQLRPQLFRSAAVAPCDGRRGGYRVRRVVVRR